MPLSPEQRAEISRSNGRRSQGPKTERGKRAASLNSYKHGCCARVVTLLHEDPEAVAARQAAWEDYYQPDSPATHHLVNECVRSTLLADRCQRRHDAAVADQIEKAAARWENARRKEVKRLADHLATDPEVAVAGLRQFGHGCRWMIARWERLDRVLKAQGFWDEAEIYEALHLMGVKPDFGHCNRQARTYLMMLCNLQLQPESYAEMIAQMLTPEYLPSDLEGVPPSEWYPAPERSREYLERMVAAELASLRTLEERVRTEEDDPERDRALDLALTLSDETEARLYFRYRGESRTTFHRAYKELVGALKREEESGSRNEPAPVVEGSEDQKVTTDVSECASGVRGPSSAFGTAAEPEVSGPERSASPSTPGEAGSGSRNEPAPVSEVEEKQEATAEASRAGCVQRTSPVADPGSVRCTHPTVPSDIPDAAIGVSRNEPAPGSEIAGRTQVRAAPKGSAAEAAGFSQEGGGAGSPGVTGCPMEVCDLSALPAFEPGPTSIRPPGYYRAITLASEGWRNRTTPEVPNLLTWDRESNGH